MLNLVIKADVEGAAEALSDALEEALSGRGRVVHRGVGAIDEEDVRRASSSSAMLIGFHTRPTAAARTEATAHGVEIRLYDTILETVADVRALLDGTPAPDRPYTGLGTAEVRRMQARGLETFAICMVTAGVLKRHAVLRVFRDGVQVYEGRPAHLRRLGREVDTVDAGQDVELMFEYFQDLQAGDILECATRPSWSRR